VQVARDARNRAWGRIGPNVGGEIFVGDVDALVDYGNDNAATAGVGVPCRLRIDLR